MLKYSLTLTQHRLFKATVKVRINEGKPQNQIESLVDDFVDKGFWGRIRQAPDGRVTGLFFSYSHSILIFDRYCHTLVLDTTYKSDNPKMPLLNIIGIDCRQQPFCLALLSWKVNQKLTMNGLLSNFVFYMKHI